MGYYLPVFSEVVPTVISKKVEISRITPDSRPRNQPRRSIELKKETGQDGGRRTKGSILRSLVKDYL